MNFLASEIAPDLQWFWFAVLMFGIVAGLMSMMITVDWRKSFGVGWIVLALGSIAFLAAAPTASDQEHFFEVRIDDFQDGLGAGISEINYEKRSALFHFSEVDGGDRRVVLSDDGEKLTIVSGENEGNVWYYNTLP
jgi:hypothetical protein